MTLAALAREVCRVIRGLHGTYPEGFALVCRQIEECVGMDMYAAVHDLIARVEKLEAKLEERTSPAWEQLQDRLKPQAVDSPRREEHGSGSGEQDSAAPKGMGTTQGEKRGPGRPRKVRVEE